MGEQAASPSPQQDRDLTLQQGARQTRGLGKGRGEALSEAEGRQAQAVNYPAGVSYLS